MVRRLEAHLRRGTGTGAWVGRDALCEEPISSSGASVSIHFHPNLMIRIHLHPADFSESFEKYGMIAASCFFCAPAIRARDSKAVFHFGPTIAAPNSSLPPSLLTEKQNPKLHQKEKQKHKNQETNSSDTTNTPNPKPSNSQTPKTL